MKAKLGGWLVTAQGRICPFCGRPFHPNPQSTEAHWLPSVDHVVALSKGGYDGWGNVLAAHRKCNAAKSNRSPTACELIWLMAVCERIKRPMQLRPRMYGMPVRLRPMAWI